MSENRNILGCYASVALDFKGDQPTQIISEKKGELFRSYIWGETGICKTLKTLKHGDYGKDLVLILFQFYVNPGPPMENLKEIENYRKKEKAIGIPIIITDENFFSKSEEERRSFLKESFLKKLDLLAEVVEKKKLDTKIDVLKSDLEKILTLE